MIPETQRKDTGLRGAVNQVPVEQTSSHAGGSQEPPRHQNCDNRQRERKDIEMMLFIIQKMKLEILIHLKL